MKKRLLMCMMAVLMVAGCVLPAAAAQPEVTAPSAILMEKSTGKILFEKNSHERLAPASVTKVMTLLLVMEALEDGRITWDDTITTSAEAAAKGGSQIYLEENEQLSFTDMLKSVVVSSANDCACALAEHIAGSESAFVGMMNERAAELGMTNTHFVNCTGLDDDPDAAEHLTTAHDIAIMSRELLRHERIKDYTTIWMDTVRDGAFGLSNTNKLVRFYDGTTGLKTGYTSGAGYCLSASAERDGMELIAVVMNCDNSNNRFSAAKAMLNFGFSNYALAKPPEDLQIPDVAVVLGKQETVTPVAKTAQPVVIDKALAANIKAEVTVDESVTAPVEQGQQLGLVTMSSGGNVIAEIPLVAPQQVQALTWWDVLAQILQSVCMA